jgi:hypothetical protein
LSSGRQNLSHPLYALAVPQIQLLPSLASTTTAVAAAAATTVLSCFDVKFW